MDTGTSRRKQAGLTAVSRLKEGPYEWADQERGTAVQPLRLGQRDGKKALAGFGGAPRHWCTRSTGSGPERIENKAFGLGVEMNSN